MKTLQESILDTDFDIKDVSRDSLALIDLLNNHIIKRISQNEQLADCYQDTYKIDIDPRELNNLIRKTFKKISVDKIIETKPKCYIQISKRSINKSQIYIVSENYYVRIFPAGSIMQIDYSYYKWQKDIYKLQEDASNWYTFWTAPDDLAQDIYLYIKK